jgi:hypothetical protein
MNQVVINTPKVDFVDISAMKADTRLVCVFCMHESNDSDYRYCCGEYGAVMTRHEYYEYSGEDYFADDVV